MRNKIATKGKCITTCSGAIEGCFESHLFSAAWYKTWLDFLK